MDREVADILALPGPELRRALESLLARRGPSAISDWEEAGKHRNRLVHRLAMLGAVDSLECLASAGVDVDTQRASDQCSALHLALWHGQPLAAEVLKRMGADADKANVYGETARDAEMLRDQRYVCWHQQADLLMSVSPFILRRLFLERWAAHAGSDANVGQIICGSDDRVVLSSTASISDGSTRVFVEEDLSGHLGRGQSIWLQGVELQAAGEASYAPPAGRVRGGGEVQLATRWSRADVRQGRLEAQRLPPEPRLPPGADALKKIRAGKVEAWDITLLAHFLADEQCRLARRLMPDADQRQLVRDLKDVRNRAGLHLGRAEVEVAVFQSTAELVQRVCDAVLPGASSEARQLIAEVQSKKIVPEGLLQQMEDETRTEHERADLREEELRAVARFKEHVPSDAFTPTCFAAPKAATLEDQMSDWSGTRRTSVWVPSGAQQVCSSIEEAVGAITLPAQCNQDVVLRCIEFATKCPSNKSLFVVICKRDAAIKSIMVEEVGNREVHKRWKSRHMTVLDGVESLDDAMDDWCLNGGVLVSSEQGLVLRVTAQFRPPQSEWHSKSSASRSPAVKRAIDVACAIEAVVVLCERATVAVTASEEARRGVFVQIQAGDDNSEVDMVSVWRGAETATDVAPISCESAGYNSTQKKVSDLFFPHLGGSEHISQMLLPHASENVRKWGEGEVPITDGNAALVAETTSKWLWTFFKSEDVAGTERALRLTRVVVDQLLSSKASEAFAPLLLIPFGELQRQLGHTEVAVEMLNRARKLSAKHSDYESGFSVHSMLFNFHMRRHEVKEARAMLVSCQALLNRERDSQRKGAGMTEFLKAKELFHASSQARLDAMLALKSKDPAALQKVQGLLERTWQDMCQMQGGMLRGNTALNIAELLSLLTLVAWERSDLPTVRCALEEELPRRRACKGQEGETAIALSNLGRVCLELDDAETGELHLSNAEDLLQSLADLCVGGSGFAHVDTLREVLWSSAMCAKQRGDLRCAIARLERLSALLPPNQDGSVGLELQTCRRQISLHEAVAPGHDLDVDALAIFIEGGVDLDMRNRKKKSKPQGRLPIADRLDHLAEVVEGAAMGVDEVTEGFGPKKKTKKKKSKAKAGQKAGEVVADCDDDGWVGGKDGAEGVFNIVLEVDNSHQEAVASITANNTGKAQIQSKKKKR